MCLTSQFLQLRIVADHLGEELDGSRVGTQRPGLHDATEHRSARDDRGGDLEEHGVPATKEPAHAGPAGGGRFRSGPDEPPEAGPRLVIGAAEAHCHGLSRVGTQPREGSQGSFAVPAIPQKPDEPLVARHLGNGGNPAEDGTPGGGSSGNAGMYSVSARCLAATGPSRCSVSSIERASVRAVSNCSSVRCAISITRDASWLPSSNTTCAGS